MSKLKPCPFCGATDIRQTSRSLDERSGYNIVHTVQCGTCGCTVGTASHQDKNGWCIEGAEQVAERGVTKWEVRA